MTRHISPVWRAREKRIRQGVRGRVLRLEPLEERSLLATFVVTSTGDQTDVNPGNGICETQVGNGICTLRAAITEANALANVGANVIFGLLLVWSGRTVAYWIWR